MTSLEESPSKTITTVESAIKTTIKEFKLHQPKQFFYVELEDDKMEDLHAVIQATTERYLLWDKEMKGGKTINQLLSPYRDKIIKNALKVPTFTVDIKLKDGTHFVYMRRDNKFLMPSRQLATLENSLSIKKMQAMSVILQVIILTASTAGIEIQSIGDIAMIRLEEELQKAVEGSLAVKLLMKIQDLCKVIGRNLPEAAKCIYNILLMCHSEGTLWNIIAALYVLESTWEWITSAVKVVATMVTASAIGGALLTAEIELALTESNEFIQKIQEFASIDKMIDEMIEQKDK